MTKPVEVEVFREGRWQLAARFDLLSADVRRAGVGCGAGDDLLTRIERRTLEVTRALEKVEI